MTDLLLGMLLGGAGMAALYASWRGTLASRRLAVVGGWALLGVSVVFWSRFAGLEFGLSYAFLFTSLAAWVAVAVNHEIRDRKGREQETARPIVPDSQAVARHLLRFAVAVPLAAVASTLAGVALVSVLPWAPVNAMSLAVLGIPVVWGVASYWACADPKALRPALSLVCIGLLGAAFVFIR